MKKAIGLYLLVGLTLIAAGCYYDHFEAIHPLAGYVNTCDPALDSTYTAAIRYIMANSCTSCHNSKSAQGNVALDTYENVHGYALSGKLLGTIEHQSGYKAMPPATKIKDCEIQKIHSWFNNALKE